jgi:predicted glycogen debranching enzyme
MSDQAIAAPRGRTEKMDLTAEWLEVGGQGGFASGTVGGERTRRYHALLLTATRPPGGRVVLVNGIEAWVTAGEKIQPLSSQRYTPDVVYPQGWLHLTDFSRDPWPTWRYALPDATQIVHELFAARETSEIVLSWRREPAGGPCRLDVRPLLSGRDYHALHRENPACNLDSAVTGTSVAWRPYEVHPPIVAASNGEYRAEPDWYRNFLYTAERDRGLDCVEDLASPGRFTFDLAHGPAVLILGANSGRAEDDAESRARSLTEMERSRRNEAAGPLAWAASCYVVDGSHGRTVLAGFPWFTDWGRDTFISLRGLALATGRLAEADAILSTWAGLVDQGMLPNRFSESDGAPEFNTVDAPLWFVVAVDEFLTTAGNAGYSPKDKDRLAQAVQSVLDGFQRGTRHGIAQDTDGLLSAGEPGLQLTWMDAKIGDRTITPRIGKPVEIQALWINALRIAGSWSDRWAPTERTARASFQARFPNPANGGLFDVVDVDHRAGENDPRIRPNQIFAVGGLPYPVLEGDAARCVVDLVERTLLTPLGLRSLAPDDEGYISHYRGGPVERDSAYHQGTVWPWLAGPFVEAWLRVHGSSATAKATARTRFLQPLLDHLETAGLGHVSEVADGDPPHTPGGCPFQAWSLGELIRIQRMLDGDQTPVGK